MYISVRTAKAIIEELKKGVVCWISIVDWDGVCLDSTEEDLRTRSEMLVREYIETNNKEAAEKKYGAFLHIVYTHMQFLCYLVIFSKEQKGLISYIETIIRWKYQLNEKGGEEDLIEVRRLLTSQLANSGKQNYEIQSYCKCLGVFAAEKRCAILLFFQNSIMISELGNSVKNIWERLEHNLQQQSEYRQDIYGQLNNGNFLLFKKVENESEIKQVIAQIRKYIGIITRNQGTMIACVGSIFQKMEDLKYSYRECEFLCDNYESFAAEQDNNFFIRNHIFEYLYVEMDGRIREGMFREWNHLFDQRPILKETCLALSKNNSSLLLAAKGLDMHQNTMIQRNRKLKEVTGLNPVHKIQDRLFLKAFSMEKKKKMVWNAGIIVQPGSVLHQGLLHLSYLLKEKSGGEFILNVHTISVSGDNHQLFDMMKQGLLDMVLCSVIALDKITKGRMEILFLPFLFDSMEMAKKIMNSIVLSEIRADLNSAGIICPGMWSMGWRYITSRNTPICVPEDMNGRKIRILASEVNEKFFSAMGATPFQIYYNNTAEALESRIIDCQENPYTNILDMGFYKYQEYILELQMNVSPEALCYSKASWEQLDESRKMILDKSVKETTEWIYQEAEAMNEKAREELKRCGMKILIPGLDDTKKWKLYAQQLFQEEQYQELLKKIGDAKKKYEKRRI